MHLRNGLSHLIGSYGRLWPKVLVDRAFFVLFVISVLLQAVGHGATALAAGLLARTLSTDFVSSSVAGLGGLPVALAFAGLAATIVKGVGATLGATIQSRLAQKVASRVLQDLAARLLSAGTSHAAPAVAARFALRVREVERGVEDGLLGGLRAMAQLVPLLAALFVLSSSLALGAVALLVPFAVLTAVARRAWKQSHARAMAVSEGLHQGVDELVGHIDLWRTYGAGEPIQGALRRLGGEAEAAASRAEGMRAALSSSNEIMAALALAVCIVCAKALAVPLGNGTLLAFAAVFFMSYRPLRDLGDARAAMQRGALALEALDDIVALAARSGVEQRPRTWTRERLVVDGICVHRGAEDAARTSFSAAPGEIVAIVGPTGAGKTTVLRALLGLEPGASGTVRYGREDLTGAGVGPWSRPFAWVPQDAPVIAGNLADNVLFSSGGDDEARRMLASIGADRLAKSETARLGATGRPVSGGERKWIGLARAIASGQPVLLLDEPTSGLDPASAARVLAALDRLRSTRTVVLVTHQREPLKLADQIVLLGEDGLRKRPSPAMGEAAGVAQN